jgi:hypothetical protein
MEKFGDIKDPKALAMRNRVRNRLPDWVRHPVRETPELDEREIARDQVIVRRVKLG